MIRHTLQEEVMNCIHAHTHNCGVKEFEKLRMIRSCLLLCLLQCQKKATSSKSNLKSQDTHSSKTEKSYSAKLDQLVSVLDHIHPRVHVSFITHLFLSHRNKSLMKERDSFDHSLLISQQLRDRMIQRNLESQRLCEQCRPTCTMREISSLMLFTKWTNCLHRFVCVHNNKICSGTILLTMPRSQTHTGPR